MPKNKFQDFIFTAIMASVMVYGMVVYNVALNTGGVSGQTFLSALNSICDVEIKIAGTMNVIRINKEKGSVGGSENVYELSLLTTFGNESGTETRERNLRITAS